MGEFINVKLNISGKIQTVKMEKGTSFENNRGIYTVTNNGTLTVFDKNKQKQVNVHEIKMTNSQKNIFDAMANNDGKKGLSQKDIELAMKMYSEGKFTNDISEFLPQGYKIESTKKSTPEQYVQAKVVNKTNPASQTTLKFGLVTASVNQNDTTAIFSNPNIIEQKPFQHIIKKGEDIVSLARKYELDTYQIIAANPQLKEGKDYKVKYSKTQPAIISTNFKPGDKITIPARYKIKKGSIKNAADVAKITGISESYIKDILTVIEPKRPGKPDLVTYDDAIPRPGQGAPTIGFGHTGRVDGNPLSYKKGKKIKITEAKAYELLAEDILKHEAMTIAYVGKKNWDKTPKSVKSAILDITYNKGIWDGFKNPHWNKYTKHIKNNLSKGEYASALCNTYRLSGIPSLLERNVYRFITGLSDLPKDKQQKAIKTYQHRYQKAINAMKKKKSLKTNVKLVEKAWNNAKQGKTTGYKMKSGQ